MNALDRRTLLKLAGAGAILSAGSSALIGCSSSGSGTGSVGNTGTDLVPWPTYLRASGPTPDLVADGEGAQDAYFAYPGELTPSVSETPGNGEVITAMIPTYSPPPKSVEDNRLWQAINEALGVDLRLNLVPIAEYQSKLATLMASNELPDIVLINGTVPRIREFISAKCADLSDFIGGDNVEEYPNLANIPTYSWQAVGRIGGRLYGIPITRGRMPVVLHVNRTLMDQAGAPEEWSQDQFFAAMQALTGSGTYGYGAVSSDLGFNYFSGSLGAPNNWKVEDGAFVSAYETDEYRAALEFAREVYAAGCYHPSSLTSELADIMNVYYSGDVASVLGSYYNYANGTYLDRVGDRFATDIALPFGDQRTSWLGGGLFGYTVFKNADADRIRLLLRVCNYLAAPYGTVEHELVNYGVEGEHFTRTADGLAMTELAGLENNNSVPISKYVCDSPDVIQVPGNEQATRRAFEYQSEVLPAGLTDPSVGLSSPTSDRELATLQGSMLDAVKAIVLGRADISTWDDALKKWRDGGGAAIADELSTEYEASVE
ncbi:extracellular solute-binding protein [Jiangella aurantiaca]|uniref:Extracellular solute-binding protein n=1 Tax=Jiangella aurantiaca TaxID=2530373 RepID=A0A4R5AFZ9_9ACTN|nr:extracellular solute-binding protein [Jiangella aurantiaca]TDD69834.1 extracellular solute-binding protein [Jiangella aurantiaca]